MAAPDEETIQEARKHKVKIIKDENKGKPSALNLVFEKTRKSDILILTDGDVYVSENSINELVKQFRDEK